MSGLTLLAALKAFDATARAGSMTAAAKLLDLQQPTISAHIQRLENEYGVELFLRQGRRLELTTCRIPDDCIDSKRYPLFIARAVLKELIESLQSIQGVKPC